MVDKLGGELATVVVPTFGRPDGLVRLLNALAEQDAADLSWSVIVVDNNSDETASQRTRESFEKAAAGLPVPARLVHESRTGASPARNRGIAEASGELVVFIDDDVVPAADWLRRLIEPILSGRCSGTGGRVVLDPSVPRPKWFTPWIAPYLADYQPAEEECDVLSLVDVLGAPYVLSASAAFRRDAIVRAGGFDLRLGPREGVPTMCDDMDVCFQVIKTGGSIRYVPQSVVIHDLPASRLSRAYLIRRSYWLGRSHWLLNEESYRRARLGGVRSMVTGFLQTFANARRTHEPQIGLRMLVSAARQAGLLSEALHQARGGVRGWHSGTPERKSAFDEVGPRP